MNHISFIIEEEYRKVGFSKHDEFTAKVYHLTAKEAAILRENIFALINTRSE